MIAIIFLSLCPRLLPLKIFSLQPLSSQSSIGSNDSSRDLHVGFQNILLNLRDSLPTLVNYFSHQFELDRLLAIAVINGDKDNKEELFHPFFWFAYSVLEAPKVREDHFGRF